MSIVESLGHIFFCRFLPFSLTLPHCTFFLKEFAFPFLFLYFVCLNAFKSPCRSLLCNLSWIRFLISKSDQNHWKYRISHLIFLCSLFICNLRNIVSRLYKVILEKTNMSSCKIWKIIIHIPQMQHSSITS